MTKQNNKVKHTKDCKSNMTHDSWDCDCQKYPVEEEFEKEFEAFAIDGRVLIRSKNYNDGFTMLKHYLSNAIDKAVEEARQQGYKEGFNNGARQAGNIAIDEVKKQLCQHPMRYRVWSVEGMVCDYCGAHQADFTKQTKEEKKDKIGKEL